MEKKNKVVSVGLSIEEIIYLESKIEIKEEFLQGVCKIPCRKMSIGIILREILWLRMESEGIKIQCR